MVGRTPSRSFARIMSDVIVGTLLMCAATIAAASPTEICANAARQAARNSGVPFQVLLAISQTETGRSEGGRITTWPWTLNIRGEGLWLDSRADALRRAEAAIASGITRFDLGCFQINYYWHGQHFSSVSQMLDPDAAADYAARFLATLHAETGSWSAAAGAYHSRTPALAARYRQRFDRFLAAAGQGAAPVAMARVNVFPLLKPGTGRTKMGSLVPVTERP